MSIFRRIRYLELDVRSLRREVAALRRTEVPDRRRIRLLEREVDRLRRESTDRRLGEIAAKLTDTKADTP